MDRRSKDGIKGSNLLRDTAQDVIVANRSLGAMVPGRSPNLHVPYEGVGMPGKAPSSHLRPVSSLEEGSFRMAKRKSNLVVLNEVRKRVTGDLSSFEGKSV